MANELAVFGQLDRMSHAPSKSTVRRMLERVTGMKRGHSSSMAHRTVNTTVDYIESGAVGAALGIMNAELKEGLDPHGVPIDGSYAGLGFVTGVFLGHSGIGGLVADTGSKAACVFSFRKVDKMLRAKKGSTAHGDTFSGEDIGSQDPIVQAAKGL